MSVPEPTMTDAATPLSVAGRTLSRDDVVALLAEGAPALHFEDCTFDGEDLSRLVLRGADLGGLKLASLGAAFKGAVLSHGQAAALVEELGVRVV